jgi:hypothetical protein
MWVWVSLAQLDKGARIEAFEPRGGRRDDDDDDDDDRLWRKLCVEPCGMWIPSGTRLRINGDFRVGSGFSLPARPSVRLDVNTASTGARVTGIVLMGVFAPVAFFGGIFTLATLDTKYEDAATASRAVFVVGLAGVGTGLALLLSNRATTVKFANPGAPASAGHRWAPSLRSAFQAPRVELGKGLSLSPAGLHF